MFSVLSHGTQSVGIQFKDGIAFLPTSEGNALSFAFEKYEVDLCVCARVHVCPIFAPSRNLEDPLFGPAALKYEVPVLKGRRWTYATGNLDP